MSGRYALLQENIVYENRWLQVRDDKVRMPDGREGTYIRIGYHSDPLGVVVIPRLADGRMLLLNINRYAAGVDFLEFPRGSADAGEEAAAAALRELREETGLSGETAGTIGFHYPDNAIMTTKAAVVVVDLPEQAPDTLRTNASEGIHGALWVSPEELKELVRAGKVSDGFTLGALALLCAR